MPTSSPPPYNFLGVIGAPAVAAGAGAGVGATITAQIGQDFAGSFTLTPAGTPAAGVLATVVFGIAQVAAPASVILTCIDINTTNVVVTTVSPSSISKTGFSVYGSAALTVAHPYLISYQVDRQD